jgi:RNA polymerase sigma factor (sigma-70 family)
VERPQPVAARASGHPPGSTTSNTDSPVLTGNSGVRPNRLASRRVDRGVDDASESFARSAAVVRPTAAVADRDAFAAWIRPHWGGMAQLARRLAPDGEWEDVLQEALSATWRKRAQFDEQRGTARNWLLAIVADQARKAHRHVVRWPARAVEDVRDDEHADPDLDRALAELSVRQRIAVVLHYYLGLSIPDVAEVMSCAPGTVKSTLADARTRLRHALGEDYQ